MSTISGVSLAERVFGIDGKVSLIAGGYSGIGAAVSLGLAEMGAKIVVAGIERDQAAAFAGMLGSRGHEAYSAAFDAVSATGTQRIVDAVVERFGRPDIPVNSVGVNLEQRAAEVTEEAFDRTVAVNLQGAMFQAQSAARQMIRQGTGGKHVHIGSVRSQLALRGRGYASYCATKGGLGTLCKQLAAEGAPYRINVNIVTPTFVNTEMSARMLADENSTNPWCRAFRWAASPNRGRYAGGAFFRFAGVGLHYGPDAIRRRRNHGDSIENTRADWPRRS
jgi:NAD(P)-dependent dehydrogenase (short-subunit alcohol dehydrogenase family)